MSLECGKTRERLWTRGFSVPPRKDFLRASSETRSITATYLRKTSTTRPLLSSPLVVYRPKVNAVCASETRLVSSTPQKILVVGACPKLELLLLGRRTVVVRRTHALSGTLRQQAISPKKKQLCGARCHRVYAWSRRQRGAAK